jgi:hypothetical protein
MFGFPRRDFLKTLAWLFGASQVPSACDGTGDRRRGVRADDVSSGLRPRRRLPCPSRPAQFDLIVVGGGLSGTAARSARRATA